MKTITLTINGKQLSGNDGDTILDICKANGIDIPTLCHFPGLSNVGACRLCVVEVEKERKPVPACTYPARDGLVVQTHTEKLEKYRRLILELLFTERNHPCAYCVASGNCELQTLAYKYQMDNVRYSYSYPELKVDAVSKYLVIDHNRCVLCGRCIRICDEIVGVHTLDFSNRGWKNLVCADLNKSLGESSCISCGACLQVCPTGAIASKFGVYQVKPHEDYTTVRSICPVCGIGCEIDAVVKENRIVRIDSPDLIAERGILCYKGRFGELARAQTRITRPLLRSDNGKLVPCSASEASEEVTSRLKAIKQRYGSSSIIGLASGMACDESLEAFDSILRKTIGTDLIDAFDGDDYRTIIKGSAASLNNSSLNTEGLLEDILKADCIIVAGADPLITHPVAGSYVLRAVQNNNASLIVINAEKNPFSLCASAWLKPQKNRYKPALNALLKAIADKCELKEAAQKKIAASVEEVDIARTAKDAGIEVSEVNKAAELIAQAAHPLILYGTGILDLQAPDVAASLMNLAGISGQAGAVISLKRNGNSLGAWKMGIAHPEQSIFTYLKNDNRVKVAYILLADEYCDNPDLIDCLKKLDCVIVEASYESPVTAAAHIVLPCPTWMESKGTYTTLDGITKVTCPIIQPRAEVMQNR